jgi:hypothetical protein
MRRSTNFWKPVAVAVLVTALLVCLATGGNSHSGKSSHSYLASALLPLVGSLDILPTGPGNLLATAEAVAFPDDPLLASLPPRGPPA